MHSSERTRAELFYADILAEAKEKKQAKAVMAELGRRDLWFLLVHLCNQRHILRYPEYGQDWLFERCREVQADPDGYLDLWAREHFKSTIITYGLTIQDILNDPELCFGIFSHIRPIAKTFLWNIQQEFERNEALKDLYPQILWSNPRGKGQAPKWSLDDGIVVKRRSNRREATVEAWGLVDGMPTAKHFDVLVFDDVVTEKSVTTPDMIEKVTQAWSLALNLGRKGGKRRMIGTRYHYNDTYVEVMRRDAARPRVYPATADGKMDGQPVLLSRDELELKRRDMGPYVFGCQMLQDPKADKAQGFLEEWLRYWDPKGWGQFNRYILVDPASEKKKDNDYTAMMVLGLGPDKNYYLIDMVRDRLNLAERGRLLFKLHRTYRPLAVGYEKIGMQSDIEHFKDLMERENYRFEITPLGGTMAKNDRIKRMIPLFEQKRVFIPIRCAYVDYEKKTRNLTAEFVNDEYLAFPVAAHDDMLDCLSRILDEDLPTAWPMEERDRRMEDQPVQDYDPLNGIPGY